jgi:hypothetical protein
VRHAAVDQWEIEMPASAMYAIEDAPWRCASTTSFKIDRRSGPMML